VGDMEDTIIMDPPKFVKDYQIMWQALKDIAEFVTWTSDNAECMQEVAIDTLRRVKEL